MKSAFIIFIALFLSSACSQSNEPTPKKTETEIETSTSKNEIEVNEKMVDLFSPSDERMFKYIGITKERVIESGLKQSQLINEEGILGGTMRIVDLKLINYKWAIATFEDGHIQGQMLLSYSYKNDEFSWKVLEKDMKN